MSSFHNQVFSAVTVVAPDARLEYRDSDCAIDIGIVREDGTKVAIECDGATHFWLNLHPCTLNLQSQIRNAILLKKGWNVVCIPQHDWLIATSHPDRSESSKLMVQYVKDALRNAQCG